MLSIFCKASPEVLCLDWILSRRRCAVVGVSSEEAIDAQRAGAPLLRRQAKRIGIVCIGKEEALGRP